MSIGTGIRGGVLAISILCLACTQACNGDGSGSGTAGSTLNISLGFAPPAGGSQDLIWIAGGGGAAGILVVEVLARDITNPHEFDAFNVEISFDPTVAEARTVTSGGVLDGCAGFLPVLKVDNVSDPNAAAYANAIGKVVFAEAIAGSDPNAPPPACGVSGERSLGSVSFRARSQGPSPLNLLPCSSADPNNPSGTCFFRGRAPAQLVPITLFDSMASIEVTP